MVDSSGHIRIIDFGHATKLENLDPISLLMPLSRAGSFPYFPPELISRPHVGGRATDWWALGVLTFELLTGCSPWSSLDNKRQIKLEIATFRMLPPENASRAAGDFILALMRKDPRQRLGSSSDEDVMRSAFFRDVDWDATRRGVAAPAFTLPVTAPNNESTNITGVAEEENTEAIAQYRSQHTTARGSWHAGMGLMAVGQGPPVS